MRYQQRAAYLDMLREWTFLDTYENTPLPIAANGDLLASPLTDEGYLSFGGSYDTILDNPLYSAANKNVALWLDTNATRSVASTMTDFFQTDAQTQNYPSPSSFPMMAKITEGTATVSPEVTMTNIFEPPIKRSQSPTEPSLRSFSISSQPLPKTITKVARPKKARRKSVPTAIIEGKVSNTRDDRNRHNLIEKRYRDSLQMRLTKLAQALPVVAAVPAEEGNSKKVDCQSKKAHILDEAVLYIGNLKKQKGVLEEANAALKESLQEVYRLIQGTCAE